MSRYENSSQQVGKRIFVFQRCRTAGRITDGFRDRTTYRWRHCRNCQMLQSERCYLQERRTKMTGKRSATHCREQTQACSITSQQREPISSEMSLLPSSGSVRQTVAGFRIQRTRVDLQSARMLITEGGRPGCGCDWKHREPFYLFQHLMELPAVGMKPPQVPDHFF